MTPRVRRLHWALLLLIALLGFALVMIPVYLIRPSAPQTPGGIALSFALRRWSPLLTLLGLVGALVLVTRLWREGRWLGRTLAVVPLLLTGALAWLSRQNHFEWMFAPLPDARFAHAAEAPEVAAGDMVLAVRQGTEAVAYPVRQLAYHHLVEDAIGGVPIVATY
jgi:hypothetical protein